MKKYLLLIGFSLIVISSIAQINDYAKNDTVYAKFGDIVTINPIVNDYDPNGLPLLIDTVISYNMQIISYNDTSVTFRLSDYHLETTMQANYMLQDTISQIVYPGHIYAFPVLIIDTLNCNQIKTPIFPQNLQFWDGYFNQDYWGLYKYPHDQETSTIFAQDLWIGGKDDNGELHLAAERYRQRGTDFWSGPLTDDGLALSDAVNAGKWFRTWKVTSAEVLNHINNYSDPNYQIPEAIETWPAHGDIRQAEYLAPFVDVDLDTEYHPENGDYPLIKGDESIFFIYNDAKEHGETEGLPLGVEIHCMAWAFKNGSERNPFNNTVFMSYKIFNRSMQTYYDTYISVWTDFDIGYASDDFVGCNVSNGNYYGYNGRDIDGNGEVTSYGENPPTQGVSILGGPYMDNDGIDNTDGECDESINGAGFGDGIIDNERYGMMGFVKYSNGAPSAIEDPILAIDYYNYMQGLWKDGSPRVYGGNAHPDYGGDSLYPSRYMFLGDSDPCNWGTNGLEPSWDSLWTEETAGNRSDDRRGLGSTGPFTFQAGSVHYLDIALVTAPGDQETPSKDLLQEYIAQIKQDYLLNPDEFGNQYLSIPEETKIAQQLLVYPNPADGDIIRFELNNEQAAEYLIYNATGQIIETGTLAAQKENSLNIGHLKAGWYILEVKIDGQVLRSKLIL